MAYQSTIVVSPELKLLAAEEDFAEELFRAIDRQREYLREWLPWVDGTKKTADTKNFLKEAKRFNIGGQRLTYFLFYKNALVGSTGFVLVDKLNRKAEIGYWLDTEYQSLGIMTSACKALINYGFTHSALNKMIIKTALGNEKSKAIPLRLGFSLEGVHKQDNKLYNHFHDVAYYAILKQEWQDSTIFKTN